MLSLTRVAANRVSAVLPRAAVASGSSRMFSIGKDIASKVREKVITYLRRIYLIRRFSLHNNFLDLSKQKLILIETIRLIDVVWGDVPLF
jgi:hypothetical protein